jgi:hypothetical protein
MLADEYADGLHEAQRQARLAIDANVLNAERLAKINALLKAAAIPERHRQSLERECLALKVKIRETAGKIAEMGLRKRGAKRSSSPWRTIHRP